MSIQTYLARYQNPSVYMIGYILGWQKKKVYWSTIISLSNVHVLMFCYGVGLKVTAIYLFWGAFHESRDMYKNNTTKLSQIFQ